ncbi:Sulfate and thiosulfate import ATP-binding protein CysA [Rhodovulum sp. PH10]|uniref:Sulfate and thiosulfate import ATP-binding protein CysA n=1 Tax=Rhodovulum sp. PH10 TaxID=1187851 RepID=UPI00027C2551|nr:Sulfate and thiosulfate import ATP-binding protein CysA [Rhodovulum sp. PH10]EJW10783.1 Sulfate and thiosulfate import ATP-binding protein CysA [Rhodovulum sp. PH10]
MRCDLRRRLRELHDKTGHTTLSVTHDQDEALELADRAAILDRGRIEQIGTPVAGFIGEAVRLPAGPVRCRGDLVRVAFQTVRAFPA